MKISLPAPTLRSLFLAAALLTASYAHAADVALHWLDGTSPPTPTGVSWGVPWPRGTVQKDQQFSLTAADGTAQPLQSWTLAYWPDGSIKWTGFATTSTPGEKGDFKLSTAAAPASAVGTLKAEDTATYIKIDTGPLQCVVSKTGSNIIDWLAIKGATVAQNGQLECVLQSGPEGNAEDSPPPREKFLSSIKKVTLEQSGPVRAVIKIEGMHKGVQSGREWLPFTVRLYFYSGETAVRLVHTIVFDGDQEKDFVRGLGVTFAVPMREGTGNRHVRFSGEDGGLWAEPIQGGPGNAQQEAGQPINSGGNYGINGAYAIWDDYKLSQPNADGFTIVKRTNPQSTWLNSNAGKRAGGLAFVGDVTGGLGISVKNFWQSYPAELEIQHASQPMAQLTAWLWSPDAPEMDMRHYDTKAHGLGPTYEDVQPGMSTAYGVGRTSELTLFPTSSVPSNQEAVAMSDTGKALPMIAATPDYIHSTGVFGIWSLQNRSTPFRASIEDGLDSILSFYQKQVDEQHWYGFWQYGDFMHSYNGPEHEWYYDFGGHAWDNTELGAPLWMWYSFLRTGRADLFRLAEAHTRDTSETNVYHLGPMKGLGTRHNVIKWGDGAKEARISQDAHWRIFYYLTTDERTGDIMRDNLDADVAVAKYDPMREAQPITAAEQALGYPGRIRTGPDWFALAGNWMTEWERTGDTKWRDRILVGVHDMAKMDYGIRTGTHLVKGWNPITADLYVLDDVADNYNLSTIQGGVEVGIELSTLLDDPDWQRLWSQYSRLLSAPANVLIQDNTTHTEGYNAQYYGSGGGNPDNAPRLAGYAYRLTKIPAFAQVAINAINAINVGIRGTRTLDGPDVLNPVDESAGVSTNTASQSSLIAIEVLELCADQLPTEAVVRPAGGGRRGAGGGGRGGAGAGGAAPAAGAPAANPAPAGN